MALDTTLLSITTSPTGKQELRHSDATAVSLVEASFPITVASDDREIIIAICDDLPNLIKPNIAPSDNEKAQRDISTTIASFFDDVDLKAKIIHALSFKKDDKFILSSSDHNGTHIVYKISVDSGNLICTVTNTSLFENDLFAILK
jgi:hypothetical protein